MRAVKILMVGFAIALSAPSLLANHAAGGYFEYTCLGSNQYEVSFYFLRDCSGISTAPTQEFFLYNSCSTTTCWPPEGIIANRVSVENIDYGCGNQCSDMPNNPDYPSMQIAKYTAVITLPYACADWTVAVSINVRNTVDYCVASGSGPYDQQYYSYCKINNTDATECHSSVKINGYPYSIGCAGEAGKSLYEVINTEGSTLQCSFVTPLAGICGNFSGMTFEGGTSAAEPYPSATSFFLNNQNGGFSFSPDNVIGKSYFAVRIAEYDDLGVYQGEIIIDGMVFVSNECSPGSTIDFSDVFFDDDNVFDVPGIQEACAEMHLTPNDNNESVISVSVEGLPSYASYTYEFNQDGTAQVYVCVDFPDETNCDVAEFPFTIIANSSDGSCMNQVVGSGFEGHYSVRKERGTYCPDTLYFTNRNNVSGIAMPLTAMADERMWIGDSMPPIYDEYTYGPEGSVIIPDGGYYSAGTEIIFPSCAGGGVSCVTVTGTADFVIEDRCSSDCYRIPLTINVREYFKCSEEKLVVEPTGVAPFTYELILLGDTTISDFSNFNIHDAISSQDNGQVPYTVNVYDAIGDMGTFSGNILGTKRFYEPIEDNKIWMTYPDGNPFGPTGWYYGGLMMIYNDVPAHWADSINTSPPWYGATNMELIVWDWWGIPILEQSHNIEVDNPEDWSLNNGEFYWTGKADNGIWADCYENQNNIFFNYTLKARNCYNDENMQFYIPTDEVSQVAIFSCTDDDPWHPEETGMGLINAPTDKKDDNNDYNESQVITGFSRVWELPNNGGSEFSVSLSPNPSDGIFFVHSNFPELGAMEIIDQTGKVVFSKSKLVTDEKINVSSLSAGIYTVSLETPHGMRQIKLVISE